MSWLAVAAYTRTGTLTSPKDTAPFQIERIGDLFPGVASRALVQDGPIRPGCATQDDPRPVLAAEAWTPAQRRSSTRSSSNRDATRSSGTETPRCASAGARSGSQGASVTRPAGGPQSPTASR